MQRSIWIDKEDWDAIREWAKKEDRTISRYLVHLHRDFVNFIEHENLRMVQKVVPEIKSTLDDAIKELTKNGDIEIEFVADDLGKPEKKKRIITEAREKIDGMINGKGYYPPRPKGQDGKK